MADWLFVQRSVAAVVVKVQPEAKSALELKIEKILPLFFAVTDCRMQIAKIALDSIASPPHRSFQHVFEQGVSLNHYYFDRLRATFPSQDALWQSNLPRRVLELIAAARSPLSPPELKFAVAVVLQKEIEDSDFESVLRRLGSFFAGRSAEAKSGMQRISFQHKTVVDWIRLPEPICLELFPDYQFDAKLYHAYKGLAALLLVLVHKHVRGRVSADQFRRDIGERLLLLSGVPLNLFLRLSVPITAVDALASDSLLFYLGEAMAEDVEGRKMLVRQSGFLEHLAKLHSGSEGGAVSSIRPAIEWSFPDLLRCVVEDLKVDVQTLLPPDRVDVQEKQARDLQQEEAAF